jgi:hypothetical protein
MTASPSDGESRPAEPLRIWERTVALSVGTVFSALAIVALFKTENEVGTAAMLLVSAAFLLIGIQGTALTRFAGGSATVELERRRRTEMAVQRAEELAETEPEVARGILEGAALIEPRVGPAAGAFHAMSYENAVRRALERARPDHATVGGADPPADLVLRAGTGSVLVSVIYRRSRSLQMTDLAPLVATRKLEEAAGGLVVTNQSTTSSVAEYISTARKHGLKIEVVTWTGPEDDGALAQALDRLGTG